MPLPKPKSKRPIPSVQDFQRRILKRPYQPGDDQKLRRLDKLRYQPPESPREKLEGLKEKLSAAYNLDLSEQEQDQLADLIAKMEGTRRSDTPMSKSASRREKRAYTKERAKMLKSFKKKSSVDEFLDEDTEL